MPHAGDLDVLPAERGGEELLRRCGIGGVRRVGGSDHAVDRQGCPARPEATAGAEAGGCPIEVRHISRAGAVRPPAVSKAGCRRCLAVCHSPAAPEAGRGDHSSDPSEGLLHIRFDEKRRQPAPRASGADSLLGERFSYRDDVVRSLTGPSADGAGRRRFSFGTDLTNSGKASNEWSPQPAPFADGPRDEGPRASAAGRPINAPSVGSRRAALPMAHTRFHSK